jgi:hypothetical protein
MIVEVGRWQEHWTGLALHEGGLVDHCLTRLVELQLCASDRMHPLLALFDNFREGGGKHSSFTWPLRLNELGKIEVTHG